MSQKPLVSVVTVVFNDLAHILQTMDSVTTQSYENLEYILIDGASSDGTKEAIVEYIKACAEITHQESSERESSAVDSGARFYLEATHKTKNLTFKFLSERDSGIYDAMNKGIDLATGEWCNFMNCGDRFYTQKVLSDVVPLLDTRYGVVEGGVEIVYDEHHRKIKYYDITFGPFKIEFSHHQASFIQTHLLQKFHYDTNFKILGDLDFYAKLYANQYLWKKIATIIASYDTNGISSKISRRHFKEDTQIGTKYIPYYPITHTIYYLFYIIPRVCIRKLLPTHLANLIRQRLK